MNYSYVIQSCPYTRNSKDYNCSLRSSAHHLSPENHITTKKSDCEWTVLFNYSLLHCSLKLHKSITLTLLTRYPYLQLRSTFLSTTFITKKITRLLRNWELTFIFHKPLINCSLKPHKWITLTLFKRRPYTRNSKGYNCAPRSSAHHSSPRKPHNYWEFWLRFFWGRQTHTQWQELSKFIQKLCCPFFSFLRDSYMNWFWKWR